MRLGAAVLIALGASLATVAATVDPLAGIRLEDTDGHAWRLGELAGAPVLLVVAERRWSVEADAWGTRLAAEALPLAPWRTGGRLTWLSVADLGRVPPWARGAARERLAEREHASDDAERRRRSPLLLDWKGVVARRIQAERGGATIVLLSAERAALVRERGEPTDEAVARVVAAIRRTVPAE